jgi:hypothetical protein
MVEKAADLPAIKKQVEYYFSDGNLERDKFFNEKIKQSEDVLFLLEYWITKVDLGFFRHYIDSKLQ